ncbi:MAG: agmatinase [Solirubrobacteraceae bacterium]|jgi:agmatinase|nr:agmatinase [Solirubrobacteraceae bacterium]
MELRYPSWEEIRSSWFVSGRSFPLMAHDTPTFMGTPLVTTPEELEGADFVIIGSPYVTSWTDEFGGVAKDEWLAAPKRVRQQSIRYRSGYIQEFGIDILQAARIVDYGDAAIPPEARHTQTPAVILASQAAVESKVRDALRAGAVPVVIGQNSPCGSYAIGKPIAESIDGTMGIVSLDTHWDIEAIDQVTMDPRIAGAGNWLNFLVEQHANVLERNLVEIGPRGMLENADRVRSICERGAQLISGWHVKTLGMDEVCRRLDAAYHGTDAVYAHFDMDVIGGSGPAPGDIMGELAEPMGMTEHEVLRIAHDVGRRGVAGLSFICIPPGSAAVYRLVVYVITYMIAGHVMAPGAAGDGLDVADGVAASRLTAP